MWSRLLWSSLERACIGAWNTSGMIISIIQMNVRNRVRRSQTLSRCRIVSRETSSGYRNSIKDIYCARSSDAFLRFLSRFPMNTAMRVFARLAGSLISRASLLDGNDRESAMNRRKRVLFLPRKGMSSFGARKSLILARLWVIKRNVKARLADPR